MLAGEGGISKGIDALPDRIYKPGRALLVIEKKKSS